jgi:hypothetical protein
LWKEAVIVFFIIITGLNWGYWQTSTANKVTATDVSFDLFIQILGTGLVILVLDQIWFAEERTKWKKIRNEVNDMLSNEISDIFADFALILIQPKVFSLKAEDPVLQIEELNKKTKEYQLRELNALALGGWQEVKRRLIAEQHLLDGEYGGLFDRRYANINDIELKYSKFLEPSQLKLLIDLERLMKSLASNIAVRLRLNAQPLGRALIPSFDDKISHRVHEIMKTLNKMESLGFTSPRSFDRSHFTYRRALSYSCVRVRSFIKRLKETKSARLSRPKNERSA